VLQRGNARTLVPVGAGVLALLGVMLIWSQHWQGPDWPAQIYRTDLFRSYGWLLWDNGWYGGHYLLSYSVLFPPLAATLGLYVAAAVSAVVAVWAFGRLLETAFGAANGLALLLFALATMIPVISGQLPFLAGEAAGLVALLAAQRRRWLVAVCASVACPLLSPVSGAFLVLALVGWTVAARSAQRRLPLLLVGVAAAPMLALDVAFPQSGTFPFWGSDLVIVLVMCALVILIVPTRSRALRSGLVVYAVVAVALFLVPNPLGGNYVRLASAVGPSLVVAAAWNVHRRALALAALPLLLLWQWSPAVALMRPTTDDPSASMSYFAPLLQFLDRQQSVGRLEIPFTRDHWEVAFVAPHLPLARGWERQTDEADNPIFYRQHALTATTYRRWLDDNGVEWIALPDVPLDYSSASEAKLLARPPRYLQPVWHDAHWQVWRVVGAPPLISGAADLVSFGPAQLTVDARAPGPILVRVHYTATFSVETGRACVQPATGGWTLLRALAPGRIRVTTSLVDHDLECQGLPGPRATGSRFTGR
jgi:hypothetical protein